MGAGMVTNTGMCTDAGAHTAATTVTTATTATTGGEERPFAVRRAPAGAGRRLPRLPFALIAALGGCVAAVTSLWMGAGQSLWFDENYTLLICGTSWTRMLALTAVDAHPPLYYMLLKAWMPLVGGDVTGMRALSAVLFGAAVAVMLILVRDLLGRRVACAVLPLLLVGGLALRYGYELRMYALAMLLVVFGTLALTRALGMGGCDVTGTSVGAIAGEAERRSVVSDGAGESARRMPRSGASAAGEPPDAGQSVPSAARRRLWWAVYALVVAAGMYTLYLTALVWLTHAVWLLVRAVRRRGEGVAAWRWLCAYLAAIVVYLPWLPTLLRQMGRSVLPPVRRSMTMSTLASAYATVMTGLADDKLPALASLALLAIAVAALTVAVALRCTRTLEGGRYAGLMVVGGMALGPLLVMTLLSAYREAANGGYGFFSVRYLSVTVLFWYAALGAVFACGMGWARARGCAGARPADRRIGRRAGAEARIARRGEAAGRAPASPANGREPDTPPSAVTWLSRAGYAATVVALVAGAVVFAVRGNYSFDREDTPGSAGLRAQVTCSREHPVVAMDEYTYIDAYYYYRDCPHYYFLDADDVDTAGGYAPLRDLPDAQLRSIDALDADSFTLLSWSDRKHFDKQIGSDRFESSAVIRSKANAAVEFHRR